MSVTLAEEAGFCFGVKRAVDLVYDLADSQQKTVTLGPVIHNPQMVMELAQKGVEIVEDVAQAPPDSTVVLRSHGVPRSVYEELAQHKQNYVDATCPYVVKIHRLATKASQAGKILLLAGDRNHPEVQGILSCADNWRSFRDSQELLELIRKEPPEEEIHYCMLAQTTFHEKEWEFCREIAKNAYTNIDIFDTICNATMLRQQAAAALAKKSDCMIVVGGYNSSNTKKLAEICRSYCRTVHIETPEELAGYEFSPGEAIGVTAGASTPAFIIKEVLRVMTDLTNVMDDMSFEEMLNESFKTINTKDKVTAVVTSVSPTEIAVDIGTKHAGYVPFDEYTDDPSLNLQEAVKAGDEIELLVLRINDQEGTAMLSKKRLDAIAGFEKIITAEENGDTLTGTVVDVVKGGVIALTNGVRVFIPASQATLNRGEDLNELKGKQVDFKILETNKSRRRAVGSVRAILRDQRKELEDVFWNSVEVGKVYSGVVKSLTSYGAFVDLGGVDGMAHISELSWSRIKHPSDVLTVGDTVEVYIKDLDPEARKISLGYKKTDDNPWEVLKRDYQIGDVAKGTVVSLTPFGAFAQIIPGVDGLIHISQISTERVDKPADVLSIGQEVDVKITDIDFDRKRVSLSMRALMEAQETEENEAAGESPELVAQAGPDSLIVDEVAIEEE